MTKEKSAASSKKGILYMLVGGGIGAILALLFAPKTGKELRGEISSATNKGLHKAEVFTEKAADKAGDIYQDSKIKAVEVYESAKQKLDSAAKLAGKMETAAEKAIFHQTQVQSSKNNEKKV